VDLRTALDRDLDALRDVYRRSSLSNPSDRDALLAHPEALEFDGEAVDEGRTVVAVRDGRIVGFATFGLVSDGVAELEDLFVDPEWKRQGIGRALVVEVAARGRRAGAAHIDVTANPDALAFYASVGFLVVGEAETRFGPAPRMSLDIRDVPNEQP
jgi:ribosomal protein S18 acetylase RimI-like enzyme